MRGGWVEHGTVLVRLSRNHFAFYRGYLDGMDLRELATRYLQTPQTGAGEALDLREVKSTIKWIQRQLTIAAGRAREPAFGRLLRVPPEKLLAAPAAAGPSLEDFREQRDPDNYYSEKELLELFRDEYGSAGGTPGPDRRAARNDRLRSKQRSALVQIEALADCDPQATDSVAGWIDPLLAQRLEAAGIRTLAQLAEGINGYGYRWYNKVPKIGEKAAAKITAWLADPTVTRCTGIPIHVRGLVQRQELIATALRSHAPPRTDIVPLDRLLIPVAIDGSAGTNRGQRCLLSAHNDLEAVHAWLSLKPAASHTYRAYRKEAERFLLWCVLEKQTALSSLTVEDCIAYRDFLWDLGRVTPQAWAERFRLPQSRWLGQRGTPRWSEFWRPFEANINHATKRGLSQSAQKTALVIVQSMLQWLTNKHYLNGNPMQDMPALAIHASRIDKSRALTSAEWQIIKDYLAARHESSNSLNNVKVSDRLARTRFILLLAYSTGLRLSELAALRRSSMESFMRDGEQYWKLNVLGKGQVKREVPLLPVVVTAIHAAFRERGHDDFINAAPELPLIAALPLYDTGDEIVRAKPGTFDDPLSDIRLYKVLKRFFTDAADSLPADQAEKSRRLKRTSTHWLRHTFATHALQKGVNLNIVRDLLGHKSISTTSIYLNDDLERSSRELEKLAASAAW